MDKYSIKLLEPEVSLNVEQKNGSLSRVDEFHFIPSILVEGRTIV